MTVDYTKNLKETKPTTAASLGKESNTSFKDLEEMICTQCYQIDKPRIIEEGSWWGFLLRGWASEPVKLYGCRHCNKPTSMVPINSREGEHAIYWHGKNKKPNSQTNF